MYEKFPTGHYAERAAWKIGWWAYRSANYAETVRVFEGAAVNFPRSDYRPPWLYWSARAHEALREQALADARYALVEADYRNSYYGRLARRSGSTRRGRSSVSPSDADPGSGGAAGGRRRRICRRRRRLPPNEAIVRALLGLELYDQALDELHYAQKVWGDSSAIQATIALDLLSARRAAHRHQRHEARLPAVPGRGRREAAARAAQGAVPDRLLAADPALLQRAPARSVCGRGADRAGVHLHRGRQVGGERLRADAAAAVHRAAVREAAAPAEILAQHADDRGIQHQDGDGVLRRSGAAVRRTALRAGDLQRRPEPHRQVDCRQAGARARRVHRRHSVSRDAELREADPRHGRGLSPSVRAGRARPATTDAMPAAVARRARRGAPAAPRPRQGGRAKKKPAPAKKKAAARRRRRPRSIEQHE